MQAQKNKLKEEHVIAITREIVKGIAEIHEANFIHRDLKGEDVHTLLEEGWFLTMLTYTQPSCKRDDNRIREHPDN